VSARTAGTPAAMSAASDALAVRVRGLRKSYGSLEAVCGLDLEVCRGEVFALLGPNGAGKTTTVEILEGHRGRDGGEVEVLGFDPARAARALRERIGIVLQEAAVEPYLTVEETVDLFRGYYPAPLPLDEILRLVGLLEQRRQRVRRLSGGQQRRLDVAIGLAGDPELLFLDEPTTGFDPAARRGAWEMVLGLRALGKTVFLTTHYMDEAQHLADRVAIIAQGRIVAEGSPEDLMGRGAETRITVRRDPRLGAPPPGVPGEVSVDGSTVTVRTSDATRALHALTGWALEHDAALEDLHVARPTLEEVYLDLVGEAGAGVSATEEHRGGQP
jgi:ABC-2 type transport system ATP-binding protein